MTVRAPPFDEALDWLHFAYTPDQTGYSVVPVSKVLVQSVVVEGGELLTDFFAHLQKLYCEIILLLCLDLGLTNKFQRSVGRPNTGSTTVKRREERG